MARVDAGRAAQAGGFVARYMAARRRCVGATARSTARRLAILIQRGVQEFDSIKVEPEKSPPIAQDAKHPDFFRAIVLLDDSALPGLEYLERWRNYVHHSGHIPRPPYRRRR